MNPGSNNNDKPFEDFTTLLEDWEEEDEAVNREDYNIYEHITKINSALMRTCERKRKQLEKFRNKNKKENEEPDILNEIDVRYIYNKEVIKISYNFIRISKGGENKYIEKIYEVDDENQKLK